METSAVDIQNFVDQLQELANEWAAMGRLLTRLPPGAFQGDGPKLAAVYRQCAAEIHRLLSESDLPEPTE